MCLESDSETVDIISTDYRSNIKALMSISKKNRPFDMGGTGIVQQQTRMWKGGSGRSSSHAEKRHDGSRNERIEYLQAMATRAFC